MALNLPLPDWVPWWAQLAILILAILFGFAFLMMPFAVFGLKGRLDFLEAQLDDIHAELRMVATRLPDPDRAPLREPVFEELPRQPTKLSPSPVQMPTSTEPQPRLETRSEPRRPPLASVPDQPRVVQPSPATPRFAEGREPAPLRYTSPAGDRTSLRSTAGDWDDTEASPRRPLRATTLRDPSRERFREDVPDEDRPRSEPTLRWPPR